MSRHSLKYATIALLALPGLLTTSALANSAYNDLYFRYDINMRNADVQISGASAFASLGNMPDTCNSLYQAVDAWTMALNWLAKVETAPVSAEDETRLSATDITAKQTEIKEKMTKTQKIIDDNCQAYPRK